MIKTIPIFFIVSSVVRNPTGDCASQNLYVSDFIRTGNLRGSAPLKNLPAGESPLHLRVLDFVSKSNTRCFLWGIGDWDLRSFYCYFLRPALSASYLRSAPGGCVAATEQPFLAAQALSPCDAQGIMHSLTSSRVCTLHPS